MTYPVLHSPRRRNGTTFVALLLIACSIVACAETGALNTPVSPESHRMSVTAAGDTYPSHTANVTESDVSAAVAAFAATDPGIQTASTAMAPGTAEAQAELDQYYAVGGTEAPSADGLVQFHVRAYLEGQEAQALASSTSLRGLPLYNNVFAVVSRTNPDPSRWLPIDEVFYGGGWLKRNAEVGAFYYANDGIDCYTRTMDLDVDANFEVKYVGANPIIERVPRHAHCDAMGGGGGGGGGSGWDDPLLMRRRQDDQWYICEQTTVYTDNGTFTYISGCVPDYGS